MPEIPEDVTADFLEPNYNPSDRPAWHFDAYLGMYDSSSSCLMFYDDAVKILFKALADGKANADGIARPLLFNMRHALELGYKFTLEAIRNLDGQTFNRSEHRLRVLHELLGREWKAACERHGIDDPCFDEYYQKTEITMREFDGLDPEGDRFRYVRRLNGDAALAPGLKVNLLEIMNRFQDGMVLLRHTADIIDDWRSSRDDAREAGEWARG